MGGAENSIPLEKFVQKQGQVSPAHSIVVQHDVHATDNKAPAPVQPTGG